MHHVSLFPVLHTCNVISVTDSVLNIDYIYLHMCDLHGPWKSAVDWAGVIQLSNESPGQPNDCPKVTSIKHLIFIGAAGSCASNSHSPQPFPSLCLGVQHGCGGILNQTSGVLRSFDFNGDGSYENNVDCRWTIFVSPNKQVWLNFTDFDVENGGPNCLYDYVAVSRSFFLCVCVCVHVWVRCVCSCVGTCVFMCGYMYVCTCVHRCTHACMSVSWPIALYRLLNFLSLMCVGA